MALRYDNAKRSHGATRADNGSHGAGRDDLFGAASTRKVDDELAQVLLRACGRAILIDGLRLAIAVPRNVSTGK